jgi:hypothetical protein
MATKTKAARTLRLDGCTLSITQGGQTDRYAITAVHDDENGLMQGYLLGFRLQKQGGDEACYDVDIIAGTCECLGYLRHCKCKHLAAICKLRDLGRI